MIKFKIIFSITLAVLLLAFISPRTLAQQAYHEKYRPQIHFSPKEKWVNDPNGMVYYKGVYHLFFQYHPGSTVWGPMHWGHATSRDLIHWEQQPVALYPDSLGYIFSGSAVVDKNNTSGFGSDGQVPLVAIFTSHDPNKKGKESIDRENQSIAYSLDSGKTWIKYAHNPVLKNPGITDFRDPKVMWFDAEKKWIMTLATKDRITFYSSLNLKDWNRESDFGKELGAHGGVWECPDLFSLDDKGKKIWVLIVNLNPGGPNKGSATQYFLGTFDGHQFKPVDTKTRWLDFGPDEYAGITWSNTGNRKLFLGWMSNWLYANVIPESTWRNSMTVPRELGIKHVGNDLFITSKPVAELKKLEERSAVIENLHINGNLDLSNKINNISLPCRFNLQIENPTDFSFVLSNGNNEETIIGYDKKLEQFYIDRSRSGKTDFQKDFAGVHTASRFTKSPAMNISLIIDDSSVELFADNGLTVMTEIYFPSTPYDKVNVKALASLLVKKLEYIKYKSIWK